MSGAAIFQATAVNLEHACKNGYEQGLGILPRDFGVGLTEQFIDPTPASKGSTFAQSFADRHEDAGRQALPGYIAYEEEYVVGIEHEEVVQIPSHFARGLHGRGNLEAMF